MTSEKKPRFHLSLVATSRNDNHGGSLTQRMQYFVDGFVEQCRRHGLSAELVLVEWNPPADRAPLAEALQWPADTGPCEIRIITVPRECHYRFEHADKLPLFQMIAKNVGIRRARGKYVLASNIDILFSDTSIRYMRDKLRPGRLYRTDRYDVPAELPSVERFDDILSFCEREAFRVHANGFTYLRKGKSWDLLTKMKARMDPRLRYMFLWLPRKLHWLYLVLVDKMRFAAHKLVDILLSQRVFRLGWRAIRAIARGVAFAVAGVYLAIILGFRWGLHLVIEVFSALVTHPIELFRKPRYFLGAYLGDRQRRIARRGRILAMITRAKERMTKRTLDMWSGIRRRIIDPWRFTNACGDFTLMSRDDWFALRGYPEWPMYSFHIDSISLYQAYYHGIREIYMGRNVPIYHIDHEAGSGYTPEAAEKLFTRLEARGIPCLDWLRDCLPMIDEMEEARREGSGLLYNDENWGFNDEDFPDQIIRASNTGGGSEPEEHEIVFRDAVSADLSTEIPVR